VPVTKYIQVLVAPSLRVVDVDDLPEVTGRLLRDASYVDPVLAGEMNSFSMEEMMRRVKLDALSAPTVGSYDDVSELLHLLWFVYVFFLFLRHDVGPQSLFCSLHWSLLALCSASSDDVCRPHHPTSTRAYTSIALGGASPEHLTSRFLQSSHIRPRYVLQRAVPLFSRCNGL